MPHAPVTPSLDGGLACTGCSTRTSPACSGSWCPLPRQPIPPLLLYRAITTATPRLSCKLVIAARRDAVGPPALLQGVQTLCLLSRPLVLSTIIPFPTYRQAVLWCHQISSGRIRAGSRQARATTFTSSSSQVTYGSLRGWNLRPSSVVDEKMSILGPCMPAGAEHPQ